jgi:hypothetical protein
MLDAIDAILLVDGKPNETRNLSTCHKSPYDLIHSLIADVTTGRYIHPGYNGFDSLSWSGFAPSLED